MNYSRIYRIFKASDWRKAADLYLKVCLAMSKEKALKKYPQFAKDIEKFVANDPSSNLKYLEWQLKMLGSGQALSNELVDIVKLFHKYHHKLQRKDLYSYRANEIATLRDELLSVQENREQRAQKTKDKYSVELDEVACGSSTVFEDDSVKVLLIRNKAASVHYGIDTQWCVRLKDHQYFEDYDSNNVIFFFILSKIHEKTSRYHKVALAYRRDENNKIVNLDIFDSNDTQLKFSEFVRDFDNEGCENILEILRLTDRLAKEQPKSLLARINSGDISAQEALEAYKKEKNPETRYQLVNMFLGTVVSLDDLYTLYKEETDPKVKENIAEYLLAHDSDQYILRELHEAYPDMNILYQNISIPTDLLLEGARSPDVNRRSVVFGNPKMPLDMLIELSNDDSIARQALAKHMDVSPSVLLRIATDPITHTNLLDNPNTPTEALQLILEDERFRHSNAAEKAIKHPNIVANLLYQFVDGSHSVVLNNKFKELTGKNYTEFAESCRDNKIDLNSAEEAVKNPESVDPMELHYLRRYVARNSQNEQLLQYLFNLDASNFINGKSGKYNMESALIDNPNLPDSMLRTLFPKHQHAIASHPKITEDMVQEIIDGEKNVWRLRHLMKNKHLSTKSVEAILRAILRGSVDMTSLATKDMLLDLMAHPSIDGELLYEIYNWTLNRKDKSLNDPIGNKLITLPQTPEYILKHMTNSPDFNITTREAAKRRVEGLV